MRPGFFDQSTIGVRHWQFQCRVMAASRHLVPRLPDDGDQRGFVLLPGELGNLEWMVSAINMPSGGEKIERIAGK
jgi:hypothetical protein